MSLAGFIVGTLLLLFGYNIAASEWQKYQARKQQRQIEERRNRYL